MAKKKFKTKVLGIFALISLAPFLAVFFTNLYLIVHSRETEIFEQQQMAVAQAESAINEYLLGKSQSLNLVVSAPVASLKAMQPEDLGFLFTKSFSGSRPLSLDFIDQDGNITMKINRQGFISYSRAYLDIYRSSSSTVFYRKLEEQVDSRRALGLSAVESDVSQSPDFLGAVSGQAYYGPIEFIDNQTDQPAIRLAAHIRNPDNEIIGIVSAEVDLSDLDQAVGNISLGQDGFVFVLDQEGRILASGQDSLRGRGSLLLNPEISQALREGVFGDKFTAYDNFSNGRSALAGKKIEDLNLFIFCDWPIIDAFAVIANLMKFSLAIAAAILLLIFIAGIFFARQIIRPINQLSQAAKEISDGNFDHKLDIKSQDEFAVLGEKFNEMARVLKENQKLKDEFVFIAAHELRTPVTAIRGYVSMILEESFGPVPKDIKENLLIVNRSNERLVQLVHDLLQVARHDAGKMKVEIKDLDVRENIKGVISELKPLADKKKIKVAYQDQAGGMAKADGYKLNEVLVNIIGNAVKYTLDQGSINIWHEQKDGELLTFIKDEGIGMSKEELDNLFQKFYRAQNQKTAGIEGTGLGLFITKEIVERMQGRIWVESEEGKGSTFGFSLKKA